MSGKRSRTKGHSFERWVAGKFRELFPGARRKLEYSKADCTGVDLIGTGRLRIQCKRYANYSPIGKIKEIKEEGIHCLVTKGDGERAVAVFYLDDVLGILNKSLELEE